MGFIAVYITHESEEGAKKLTDHLLKKKIIACANLFPMQSVYWWEGSIANENEWVSIVKTTTQNWEWLEAEVTKVHPYTVPCLMKMQVTANKAYEEWIAASVV